MFSIRTKVFFTAASFFLTFNLFSQMQNPPKAATAELDKVLDYFKKAGNSEQYEAALFLVNNISSHYSSGNIWLDKTGKKVPFEATKFSDIEEAIKGFKKIKDSISLTPKETTTKDSDVIQATFLIKNVELAYQSWKQNPWSSSYDFKTFCEYILPYRSLTEPLENWRSEYQSLYEKNTVDLTDKTDPVELCSKIIASTKHFDFVAKRFDPKTLLGPAELLFWRQGNCPDLANVALFASRSLGVAVTFDFTPHFAASSNRHYWNTVIDAKGVHIPFNGNQDLPYIYNANSKRLGKVFRVAFSEQKQSLAAIVPESQIACVFLKSKNIIDVTSEYVPVSAVNYTFATALTSQIGYINVFNRGSWNIVDWAKITAKKAIFTSMGRNIVYLPSNYAGGKILYEKYPILLDTNGIQTILKPDNPHLFIARLSRSNETKNEFKDNNPFQILKGEKYNLYVWNGNWQLIGQQLAAGDDLVTFKNVPKNALFLMASDKPDFFERIFTIDAMTSKITWY
nr:transglutaminase domain-containing protein [uncultured Flavobacterium sp.]